MAKTLLDLRRDVLSLLGENSDSPIAELTPAAGGAAVRTSDAQITLLINQGADYVARKGFILQAQGTIAFSANDRNKYLTAATVSTTGARALRTVFSAAWAGSPLSYLGYNVARARFGSILAVPGGTPKRWYRDIEGNQIIGLEPYPTASGTLTVYGAGLPTYLSADTDTFVWLPDDWARAVVCYAALQLCIKVQDDEETAQRAENIAGTLKDLMNQMRQEVDPAWREYLDDLDEVAR